MSKFYFVRHGESEANAAGIVADKYSKLTQKGLEQARITGNSLKQRKINLIITSPYVRAQQTAETIAAELGIEIKNIKIVEQLRERGLGECEGRPKDMESERFFEIDSERGFESQKVLILRTQKALSIIEELIASTDGAVVVIGHAISGFYLRQIAAGLLSVSRFEDYHHMSNADFIEVEIIK